MKEITEASREAMRENGRRQGTINVRTGHWNRVRKRGERLGGKIVGRQNVENGTLARAREVAAATDNYGRGGDVTGPKPENIARISAWLLKIDRAEAGRKSAHVRLHAERFDPQCKYCAGNPPESFLL